MNQESGIRNYGFPIFRKISNSSFIISHSKEGFTLLEVVLVVAILAIISAAGIGFYRNFAKGTEFSNARAGIVANLVRTRSRAMAGESGLNWGVHFVNSSTQQYYETFSTPTTYTDVSMTVDATSYLPGTVVFVTPSSNSSSAILFSRVTGAANSSSIVISFEGRQQTVNVSAIGTVY